MDARSERFLAKGYSLEALAGHLLIDRDTLFEWMNKGGDYFKPNFSEAVKRGLDRGREFWERIGIEMSTMNSKQRPGNFVTWIFNMKNRYGWADKTEVAAKMDLTENMQDFISKLYEKAGSQGHTSQPANKSK